MMIMCALKANYINKMVGKSLCVYKHCLMVGGNDSSRRTFHLNSETHLLSESETEKWPEMTLVLTFYFHSWCHPLNHFISYFGLFIQVFQLFYFIMHSIHEQRVAWKVLCIIDFKSLLLLSSIIDHEYDDIICSDKEKNIIYFIIIRKTWEKNKYIFQSISGILCLVLLMMMVTW